MNTSPSETPADQPSADGQDYRFESPRHDPARAFGRQDLRHRARIHQRVQVAILAIAALLLITALAAPLVISGYSALLTTWWTLGVLAGCLLLAEGLLLSRLQAHRRAAAPPEAERGEAIDFDEIWKREAGRS